MKQLLEIELVVIKLYVELNDENGRFEVYFNHLYRNKPKRFCISSNQNRNAVVNQVVIDPMNTVHKIAKKLKLSHDQISVQLSEDFPTTGIMYQHRSGIQPGQSATTDKSKDSDNVVRRIASNTFCDFNKKYPNLEWTHTPKISKEELEGTSAQVWPKGLSPDGGCVRDVNGNVLVTFEAKHQGCSGNANDRAYKNVSIVKRWWPDCSFVFFMTGLGANVDSPKSSPLVQMGQEMMNIYNIFGQDEFNMFHPREVSYFCKVGKFEDNEVYKYIMDILETIRKDNQ